MKKILITGLFLIASMGFSAEAKYNLEQVEQDLLNVILYNQAKNATLSFLYQDFNNYTLNQVEEMKKKDSKYDEKEAKNLKDLYIKGLKYILSQLGYESNFQITEGKDNNVELKYYIDKELTAKDTVYVNEVLVEIVSRMYSGKEINLSSKRFSDDAFKKEYVEPKK